MLRLFKALKATPETSAATPVDPIVVRLRQVQQRHELIHLSLSDDSQPHYQSIILEVDEHNQRLVIDEVFPHGLTLLPEQRLLVSLREQQQGQRPQLSFYTHVVEPLPQHNTPGTFQLALPKQVNEQQRREAYRMNLTGECFWRDPEQRLCRAVVEDISATGVRLSTQDAAHLHPGEQFSEVELNLAGLTLNCDIAVARIESHENSNATTVGARLLALDPVQRRALESLLMNRQRRQRLRVAPIF